MLIQAQHILASITAAGNAMVETRASQHCSHHTFLVLPGSTGKFHYFRDLRTLTIMLYLKQGIFKHTVGLQKNLKN